MNSNFLEAVPSLAEIFASRWDLPKDKCISFILSELEFEDLLGESRFQDLSQELSRTPYFTLEENDYTFPHKTDVFGCTRDYWEIVNGINVSNKECYNTLDLAGQSALHHAVDKSPQVLNQALVAFQSHKLLEDSNLMIAKCNKQTPLHRAARLRDSKAVHYVLAKGVDPNTTDFFGRTALCLAAYDSHSDVFKELWNKMDQKGRNQTDIYGRNALHYAFLKQKENAADLQQQENAAALKQEKEEIVMFLINHGFDFNARDRASGRAPLWYAASEGMKGLIEALLGKDLIDLASLGVYGTWYGPIKEAERAGHKEIAKMLREWKEKTEQKKPESGKEVDLDQTLNEEE